MKTQNVLLGFVLLGVLAGNASAQDIPLETPVTGKRQIEWANFSVSDQGRVALVCGYLDGKPDAVSCPLSGPDAYTLSIEVYHEAKGTFVSVNPYHKRCYVVVRSDSARLEWEKALRSIFPDVIPTVRDKYIK